MVNIPTETPKIVTENWKFDKADFSSFFSKVTAEYNYNFTNST